MYFALLDLIKLMCMYVSMYGHAGPEREARGPDHSSSAIGFTFRKGEFLFNGSLSLFPL